MVQLETADINDAAVVRTLENTGAQHVIFAGPSAAIVRTPLFETGKHFIHVHPGRLPEYRGSTPMYYTLLAGASLTATAILMNPVIDQGEVLWEREFPPPEDKQVFDLSFDPWMRAMVLVDVMRHLAESSELPNARTQTESASTTYYVIHPVLKHLALMSHLETNIEGTS